ncbi:MAG: trigger factor [Candidatus Hydrothermales bacterium]
METERVLTLKIKRSEIVPYIEKFKKEYQRVVKIPGFRQGKAPLEIVWIKYKKEIEENSLEEFLKSKVIEELKKDNSKLISPIIIKDKKEGENELEVTVYFEVLPFFEVKGFERIKVQKRIKRPSPDEIEKRIKKYQESLAEFKDKETPLTDGDFVVIKYNIKDITGREILKGKIESFKFNRENVSSDFYNELIGKKRNDSFKVARTEKSGTLIYEGNIISVKEVILPEINDEFARMFEMENLEKFKKKITEEIEEDLKKEAEIELENKILEELSALNPIPVPRSYTEEELRLIISRYKLKEEELKERFDEFYKLAEERVRRRLLLDRLAEQLKIEINEKEIDEEVKRISDLYKMDYEFFKKRLKEREFFEEVESSIKRKKAMNFLKNNVKMEVIVE